MQLYTPLSPVKDDCINNFIARFLDERKISKASRKEYSYVLYSWSSSMPATMADLTIEHIERYLLSLQKDHKESTCDKYIRVLKAFSSWLSQYGYPNWGYRIDHLDAQSYDQRILSRQEYNKVCSAASDKELDCFRFMCNTGLRVSEVINLKPHHVNLNTRFIQVFGKGKKHRGVPMNRTVRDIIERNPTLEFVEVRHRCGINRLCERLSKLAQIPAFNPHSCRHYFANELWLRNVPLDVISLLLGHEDTKTTLKIYIHFKQARLAGATDCLDD